MRISEQSYVGCSWNLRSWLLAIALAVTILITTLLRRRSRLWSLSLEPIDKTKGKDLHDTDETVPFGDQHTHTWLRPGWSSDDTSSTDLKNLRLLFHRVHNLERFPNVLKDSRDTLVQLLSETLLSAQSDTDDNIQSIKRYDQGTLLEFINGVHKSIGTRWEAYLSGREAGARRELFQDRAHAVSWLKENAPSKLVDGAWLGHVHRFPTAFAHRHITRNAWQIFSEEIGDGDLAKNHAYLYRELLHELQIDLPSASDETFIAADQGMDKVCVWRSAVAQLLISLFPDDFLPEILGFNMHFELLTWDTLCATKELQELGIDPKYFMLHISIDNAHSGHTAMAYKVVVDFLEHIRRTQDETHVQEAWRRIQTGYCLSEYVTHSSSSNVAAKVSDDLNIMNPHAKETLELFRAKALSSPQLHCTSRARIGGKSIEEWLSALSRGSAYEQEILLGSLGRSKTWIRAGSSHSSRLVQALSWKGKMYGAFSESELKKLCMWIDHLISLSGESTGSSVQCSYFGFTGRTEADLADLVDARRDILVDYPVIDANMRPVMINRLLKQREDLDFSTCDVLVTGKLSLDRLLPLWFASTALIEGLVTIPARICNKETSALVHVLRRQRGFCACDHGGCAGLTESMSPSGLGLHELGCALASRGGMDPPSSFAEVFQAARDEIRRLHDQGDDTDTANSHCTAELMLHMSMAPLEYEAALVGIAWAFACFHRNLCEYISSSTWSTQPILDAGELAELSAIAEVEINGLQIYMHTMQDEAKAAWSQGFDLAQQEIRKCFTEVGRPE